MLVALGVGGGIAAYKAPELVRALDKAGADVQVVLTRNAARFVSPLTLQTLSRRKVLSDPWELDVEATVRHVELTREASVLAIAPATANLMGKIAHGIADDFLTTFYTACRAPVVVAPAMNTRMWLHPPTRDNVRLLESRGVEIIPPEAGWLAEREVGVGRLAAPDAIVDAILRVASRTTALVGKRCVVSAGPTREPIDPVRYLSNRSSGKMGYALADALARRGAEVVLVSGPVALPTPFGVDRVSVETAREMREAVFAAREGAHAVFMAAAVSDYTLEASRSKIKKSAGGARLDLDPAPDILAELGRSRGSEILVGFAAETDDVRAYASEKLERKNCDFIVANDVSTPGVGMDADDNAVTVIARDGRVFEVPKRSKHRVAEAIVDAVLGAPP